ncbi:hypothetical protein L596_009981 [Steinernema carpocapsae]|uniref:BRCT domain-containing protein n=1 Tax=Steinernema carpocapsae TaxID=34508 RepID=A0A4U5PGX6_STECR|nr:hypothetical protein L596_009981 [Steinernema carpocapsae]
MNGRFTRDFLSTITHLIADQCNSESAKYKEAMKVEVPVVSAAWIDEAWRQVTKERSMVMMTLEEVINKFKVPIFAGMVVTASGLKGQSRDEVIRLVPENGGEFTGEMKKATCTHLITDQSESEKVKRAKQWGTVKIVGTMWVRRSIEKGYRLPEKYYPPGTTAEHPLSSTPTDTARPIQEPDISAIPECSGVKGFLGINVSNVSANSTNRNGVTTSVSRVAESTQFSRIRPAASQRVLAKEEPFVKSEDPVPDLHDKENVVPVKEDPASEVEDPQKDNTVGNASFAMKSTLLGGRTFRLDGFEGDDHVEEQIVEHGGVILFDRSPLIADYSVHPLILTQLDFVEVCVTRAKEVVSWHWLYSIFTDYPLNPVGFEVYPVDSCPLFRPIGALNVPKNLFAGCVVTMSSTEIKWTIYDEVKRLLENHGAVFQREICGRDKDGKKKNTHVIVGKEGPKSVFARKWNIPIVDVSWVIESMIQKKRLPEEHFPFDESPFKNYERTDEAYLRAQPEVEIKSSMRQLHEELQKCTTEDDEEQPSPPAPVSEEVQIEENQPMEIEEQPFSFIVAPNEPAPPQAPREAVQVVQELDENFEMAGGFEREDDEAYVPPANNATFGIPSGQQLEENDFEGEVEGEELEGRNLGSYMEEAGWNQDHEAIPSAQTGIEDELDEDLTDLRIEDVDEDDGMDPSEVLQDILIDENDVKLAQDATYVIEEAKDEAVGNVTTGSEYNPSPSYIRRQLDIAVEKTGAHRSSQSLSPKPPSEPEVEDVPASGEQPEADPDTCGNRLMAIDVAMTRFNAKPRFSNRNEAPKRPSDTDLETTAEQRSPKLATKQEPSIPRLMATQDSCGSTFGYVKPDVHWDSQGFGAMFSYPDHMTPGSSRLHTQASFRRDIKKPPASAESQKLPEREPEPVVPEKKAVPETEPIVKEVISEPEPVVEAVSEPEPIVEDVDDVTAEAEPEPMVANGPKKVFYITGMSNDERLKRRCMQIIKDLGGELDPLDGGGDTATHLVAQKLSRSEKTLSAVARGLWVLTPQFLFDSLDAGRFLEEDDYEHGRSGTDVVYQTDVEKKLADACRRWRLKLKDKVEYPGGAFSKWSVAVYGGQKTESVIRLIQQGGGKATNKSELGNSFRGINQVLMDSTMKDFDKNDLRRLVRWKIPCYKLEFTAQFLTDHPLIERNCYLGEYKRLLDSGTVL